MNSKLWTFGLVALLFGSALAARAEGPYHFFKTIPVGGGDGWDYLSIDETRAAFIRRAHDGPRSQNSSDLSATAKSEPAEAGHARPKLVSGTMKVLVYEMQTAGQ